MSHEPPPSREIRPTFRPPPMHPLEEVLRIIERDAPEPFYPAAFLRYPGRDPEQLDAILGLLELEGLTRKVRGHAPGSGAGVVLTDFGREVLRDPESLRRLARAEPLREGDVGGVIRRDLRSRVRPVATYVLIAVNAAIFVLGELNPAWGDWMKAYGVATPKAVADGEWWRLLSCTFLHGGQLHVLGNLVSLYVLGRFVEPMWGRWRFLTIYFLAGWAGSCLGVQYCGPAGLVGASGSVFGLLGAIGLWFLLYRKHIPGDFARIGLFQVGINVALNVALGFLVPNISNSGHLGGGLGGAAAALILHVQRFGLPGLRKKPALNWVIAVALLVAEPVACYVQMRLALAGRSEAKASAFNKDGGARGRLP